MMIMLLFALPMVLAMSIASIILVLEESATRREMRPVRFGEDEHRR